MATPQEVLKQSTDVATKAAQVAGLTFQPGATVQNNQIVKTPNPVAPSIVKPLDLNTGPSYDSSAFKTTPTTYQDLQKKIEEAQNIQTRVIGDTSAITNVEQQLADIRAKEKAFNLSLAQGQEAQYGLGRPLEISTGRARELARQNEFTQQSMKDEEANLLADLGIKQEQYKAKVEGAKAAVDTIQSKLDTQMKIDTELATRTTQAINAASTWSAMQRNTAADILEGLKGQNPAAFSPDTISRIVQIAAARGIDPQQLLGMLKLQYQQQVADTRKANLQAEKDAIDIKKAGTGGRTESEIVNDFNKDLTDRSGLDKAGTREQYIRQLVSKYPEINRQDITDRVYATYPDKYEYNAADSNAIDYYAAQVKSGKVDISGVPANIRNAVAARLK